MSAKRHAVVVDSSVLIAVLLGEQIPAVHRALAESTMVLSPIVIAEALSGELTLYQREMIGELLQDYPLHPTPLEQWMNVGSLRRILRAKGINATIPDAHVAQGALDLGTTLLTRDDVFVRIAEHTPLRLD